MEFDYWANAFYTQLWKSIMEAQFLETVLRPLNFLPSEQLNEQKKLRTAVDGPCLHTCASP